MRGNSLTPAILKTMSAWVFVMLAVKKITRPVLSLVTSATESGTASWMRVFLMVWTASSLASCLRRMIYLDDVSVDEGNVADEVSDTEMEVRDTEKEGVGVPAAEPAEGVASNEGSVGSGSCWVCCGSETVSISGTSPFGPPPLIATAVPADKAWAIPPIKRVAPPAPAT